MSIKKYDINIDKNRAIGQRWYYRVQEQSHNHRDQEQNQLSTTYKVQECLWSELKSSFIHEHFLCLKTDQVRSWFGYLPQLQRTVLCQWLYLPQRQIEILSKTYDRSLLSLSTQNLNDEPHWFSPLEEWLNNNKLFVPLSIHNFTYRTTLDNSIKSDINRYPKYFNKVFFPPDDK